MSLFKNIRYGFRRVKWWFWRANGKVPPCDWWDFKYNLADYIRQGLEGLLYDGNTAWDSDYHKKEKADLEYVLAWAKDFPVYHGSMFAADEEEKKELSEKHPDVLVLTSGDWAVWDKRQQKAFRLLAKNYNTLWD